MILPQPTHALVRAVPDSYAPFYQKKGILISAAVAISQHRNYVSALQNAGLSVSTVAPDTEHYDSVFIEDTAVVWDSAALITRLAPDRDGEQAGVEAVLRRAHRIVNLPAGALLEGGDVLHTDNTTYVGLSSRTNKAGADALAEFMAAFRRRVVQVPVTRALHLKTAATYIGDGVLIAAPGVLDLSQFEIETVIMTEPQESAMANCLRVKGCLFVPAGYPLTRDRLRTYAQRHGLALVDIPISEFEKAEGSLTCLSLLWRDGKF